MSIIPEEARVAALCRRFNVRRLELFGSAATGRFDPVHSDLDLLVEFAPMSPGAYAAAYFGLREALEAACGRPVDLVTEAALANPYLIRRISAGEAAALPAAMIGEEAAKLLWDAHGAVAAIFRILLRWSRET